MKQRGKAGRKKGAQKNAPAGWMLSRAAMAMAMAIALAMMIMASASGTGTSSRISTDSAGLQANGASQSSSVSAYGGYVVFRSIASNLVPGDTNNNYDIFRKDLATGETLRVSTSASGAQADGGVEKPVISGDGRYVAFTSTSIVLGNTNTLPDVFLKDMVTGAVTMVSTDSAGHETTNGQGRYPDISTTGRYVAFESNASTLVYGDTNGPWFAPDVFVKDTLTGITTRVSTSSSGEQAYNNVGSPQSGNVSISADGRYVAFYSSATNLIPVDSNSWMADIYVKDTITGATTIVSTNAEGVQGNSPSVWADISADGRYVAFQSGANNLVPGDTNARDDIFVKDRLTGAISRVSTDSAGVEANSWEDTTCGWVTYEEDGNSYTEYECNTSYYGGSYSASISEDGKHVVFGSSSSNLVPGDTNGQPDVFAKDILTGETVRISAAAGGVEGNNTSGNASISAYGDLVSFHSMADNLVAGDTNGVSDIFLAENQPCQSGQPVLSLNRGLVYWGSYADYEAHELSVDYVIGSTGAETAYGVRITGSANTGGVTSVTGMPVMLGDISGGASAETTLRYSIPAGVSAFKSTIYATALDACGNSYSYPGATPGT